VSAHYQKDLRFILNCGFIKVPVELEIAVHTETVEMSSQQPLYDISPLGFTAGLVLLVLLILFAIFLCKMK
jgi:hypothetical protein